MVIVAPMPVKLSPKSFISQGNSGGSRRWKKCDTPCTKPISEIASRSWLAGGDAAAGGMAGIRKRESAV